MKVRTHIRQASYFALDLCCAWGPTKLMKTTIPLLVILSLLVVPGNGEEGVADYWWNRESPENGSYRVVDMKHACKITVADGRISLFRENGGKLEEYFTSTNSKIVSDIKQQVIWAPSRYVVVADGLFVNVKAATSLEFGGSSCSLRAGLVEFAKLTDPAQIKKVLQIVGYESIPGGRFK
jgi:hypothetical protein